MTILSTPKQLLIISYSILAVVLGVILAITYDSFGFLVPIALANLMTFYIICKVEDNINWKGLCMYFASLFISFSILFSLPLGENLDELRHLCIEQLSVMYVIIGVLSGGIARYKVERYENKKQEENNDEG